MFDKVISGQAVVFVVGGEQPLELSQKVLPVWNDEVFTGYRGYNSWNSQTDFSWKWWFFRYCWWKKSCTSWYGKYPIIFRVFYIPGGAGFLPSTVSMGICRWSNERLFFGSTSATGSFVAKVPAALLHRHWWIDVRATWWSSCMGSRFWTAKRPLMRSF